MPDFPHLPLREVLAGNFKFKGQYRKKSIHPTTKENLDNRASHGTNLSERVNATKSLRSDVLGWRKENGFPDLPEKVICLTQNPC